MVNPTSIHYSVEKSIVIKFNTTINFLNSHYLEHVWNSDRIDSHINI